MRIELDNPKTIIIQPEITNELTGFTILQFEDDGKVIRALTNLGYVTIYEGIDYPEGGGIFGLDKEDVIDIITNAIINL